MKNFMLEKHPNPDPIMFLPALVVALLALYVGMMFAKCCL
jgi:hypothetical protein